MEKQRTTNREILFQLIVPGALDKIARGEYGTYLSTIKTVRFLEKPKAIYVKKDTINKRGKFFWTKKEEKSHRRITEIN